MVEGRFKSRNFRRVFKKIAGSKTVLHFRRRKPSHAVCASCGARLKGVARGIPSQVKKLSKSEKRPERPFGGMLCSSCTRRKIITDSRK